MDLTSLVVVTGATGGIGQAICRMLSAQGYAVVVHFHQNSVLAMALQREIREGGGICHVVEADLSEPQGAMVLARGIRCVLEKHHDQVLHGLVNNAAILTGPSLKDMNTSDIDLIFAVNVKSPLLLSADLLPLFRPGGSIVNISSASAHISSPGNMVYAMSKAAIESLTRNLAEAIAPRGLRVNAIVPGFTDNGHPAFQNPKTLRYMSSFSVLGGVASAETIAQAVLFLLSEQSGRTTGSLLDVSGGTTLRPRGDSGPSVQDVISQGREDATQRVQ